MMTRRASASNPATMFVGSTPYPRRRSSLAPVHTIVRQNRGSAGLPAHLICQDILSQAAEVLANVHAAAAGAPQCEKRVKRGKQRFLRAKREQRRLRVQL